MKLDIKKELEKWIVQVRHALLKGQNEIEVEWLTSLDESTQ